MVGKIPDPENLQAMQSGHSGKYAAARYFIQKFFGPIRSGLTQASHDIHVTVTGVGFVNKRNHGTGAAKNGFELHPILSIE